MFFMRKIISILMKKRWMMLMGLSFIVYHLSLNGSVAQSLYEQNIRLGEMFQSSGCLKQAEQYYQTAISHIDHNDKKQWVDARLHIVDLQKFWHPVEAQKLNDEIINDCKAWPELYQHSLAINAYINFWMNNKASFNKANEQYLEFCRQHEDLPTTYDKPLQAMHEALNGFYNDALRTIDQNNPGSVLRHQLRLRIFEMKGDNNAIIRELRQRSATIDSLIAATYSTNLNEVAATHSMTLAQQKAEKRSSDMVLLTLLMAIIIVMMFGVWMYLHRRHQKKLEKKNKQLSAALKMASETDQMKLEFVQRVSHEIRTPLNAITGFNEILNNPDIPLSQEERKDLVDRINENVKAITGIVDELLQVANTESMQDYAHYDTVLCNQFLSDLIKKNRDNVGSNIELRYTTSVINRFSIQTNRDIMEKIIEHLLGNAIKFTKQGFIELNCAQKLGKVIITITDTGCGIPPEKQDEVFEQFAKADSFHQGIGLGLTVSRKMAQKMGGDLQLDKNYTGGARFILSLPVK